MTRRTRPLFFAGAGLAAVLALGACGAGAGSSGSMNGMSGHGGTFSTSSTSAASSSRAGDVMFAQMMIPHHQQAIEMADLALTNDTTSTAVRTLAEQIKGAQDPEIQTMQGWLREWGAPTGAAMDHGTAGMMTAQDMASLKAARGQQFNRMWLQMMVEHHQGAVTMAQDVQSTTEDPRVRQLAQSVVDGQKKEIATMQGLLG